MIGILEAEAEVALATGLLGPPLPLEVQAVLLGPNQGGPMQIEHWPPASATRPAPMSRPRSGCWIVSVTR